METTLKILKKFNREDIQIGIGDCYGTNSFPSDWRAKPKILNALPDMIGIEVNTLTENHKNAVDIIIDTLTSLETKAKILITGPCTNLVNALLQEPEIKHKIEEVIWMAGAFNVRGNVVTYNHDNSAEWNVFWDPKSASKLLEFNLPITFIPLDVTNKVPVSLNFLKKLANFKDNLLPRLACQFWATTLDTIPSYEYTYFMWDVLATSYLAIPESFTVNKCVECEIHPSGSSAGKTQIVEKSQKYANIAIDVNRNKFYDYLLNSLTEFEIF